MNSISEYVESDAAARIGSFRSTGGMSMKHGGRVETDEAAALARERQDGEPLAGAQERPTVVAADSKEEWISSGPLVLVTNGTPLIVNLPPKGLKKLIGIVTKRRHA
jgi:hypothetical protein